MYKSIQKMLVKMRDELIEEIATSRKMGTNDLMNEIGDLYDLADKERDLQLSHILGDRYRDKLLEIDDALERIDEGSYGICEECGKRIASERLKVMPFARLCVPCKSSMEKRVGQFKRTEEEMPYRELSNIDMEDYEE